MIEDYYTSYFDIKSPLYTNANGVFTETYSVVTTIKGMIRPLSGNEIIQNEKLNYITTHRFYCGVCNIQNNDKIVDTANNKVYNVELIRNPMNMGEHLEIDCKYIEDEQS